MTANPKTKLEPVPSLEWLLAPVTPAEFFERHWEREPLVIRRNDRSYYGSLLTLDEFDRALTAPDLRRPNITVTNAEAELTEDDYMTAIGDLDLVETAKLLADGASVTVSGMHRRVETVANLCRMLESQLSYSVHANAYFSPRESRGFRRHYDLHDVLVLQVMGSKRWSLYHTPIEFPLPGQRESVDQHGPATMDFELQQGDLAYVPRGRVHDAHTTGETSLHLTVGLSPYHWSDLLVEALASTVLRDGEFRRSLPPGFAQMSFDRTEARKMFRALLERFADSADADAAFDAFAEEFITTRRPVPRGPLSLLASLENLSADTIVGRRADLIFDLREDDAHIRLRCEGREIRLPRHAGECVRFALSQPSFTIGELPHTLDDDGKMVLVRRLIQEGVLQVQQHE
jgi:ribosomal protein L16 Arg81 hydroxylase